jgi:membrane associated rhomboid family serine protease
VIYSNTKYPEREKSVEPLCSKIAYNPDRRWEVWRFVTYAFMHANTGHLLRNLVGQIVTMS